MRYCKRCLYPENHPLKITLDDEGVCSGCRVHEEKFSLDWDARFSRLKDLLKSYKNNSGKNYDCIIPVSGARDSYFIVHIVKNVLGFNPLLVSYNKHWNTNRGHRNLAYLKIRFNCDAVESIVDPAKVKNVTRASLKHMGSMYWHVLAGRTAYPVQVAVRHKVPLIIWGAHQGLDQVGMYSHLDEVEMTRKYRKEHDLMGVEAEDLLAMSPDLREDDIIPFLYPHDKEIEKTGVRGIYLGNYIPWDSKKQHELMIEKYGYETGAQQRTFDTYNDVDCQHYSGIHDYIKLAKWGYGKVTDHASREIRWGRLTREEGIDLVRKYQNVIPKDLPMFTQWLGITSDDFHKMVNKFRDPKIWKKRINGDWELLDSVVNHANDPGVDSVRLKKTDSCVFQITPSRAPEKDSGGYELLNRGYVDGHR